MSPNCTQCRDIRSIETFGIGFVILNPFPNGSATKLIGPGKTPIFRLYLVAMATSLEKSKKFNEVNMHLHPSTIPEILVKIVPLGSEPPVLEPLTKKKYKKNWQSVAYSPLCATVVHPSR